ncbi:MAG: biopolymer transporter ExbD [Deltaproteobacteria bacterium]|nr:biopolymer transporter ExbD [Deltaproteobacteria bacterium]
MFKRPSSRKRKPRHQIFLNLVPIIDTMVVLIGFLLFTMAFLVLVSMDSPFPTINPQDIAKKLLEKPLQLTVTLRESEVEIWSPFQKITPKKIPNIMPGQPDIKSIHNTLVEVKQKFPAENKIVLVPFAGTNYETIIAVMDGMRLLEKIDPVFFAKNPRNGIDEQIRFLFPEVIFGNLLGDS